MTLAGRIMTVAIVGAALYSAPAHACSCDPAMGKDILQHVSIAFRGKVVTAEPVSSGAPSPSYSGGKTDLRTTFEVEETIKGQVPRKAHVYTVRQESLCGYDFSRHIGRTFVVPVVTDNEGRMITGLCRMLWINMPEAQKNPRR